MPGCTAGYFGKLPGRGDFLRQNLPAAFLGPWEDWLQAGLRCASTRWPADWKSRLLAAPVWHFHVTAGLCGPSPAVGLLVPSRDRVGRAYPLTLAWVGVRAKPLEEIDRALAALHGPLSELFQAGGLPEALDRLLASVSVPLSSAAVDRAAEGPPRGSDRCDAGGGFPHVGAGQSCWWTRQHLMMAQGLPSMTLTADLLCSAPSETLLAGPSPSLDRGAG